MLIRKCEVTDGQKMLKMLQGLDKETKYMLLEDGERSTDISRMQRSISDINSAGGVQFIAIEDDEIVGFLTAKREVPKKVKHIAYIVVGIRQAYRGQGIGNKMFQELDKWAKENKVTRLELTVIYHNSAAKNLYEKNGFEVEGIKKNSIYMDGIYIDEYYMAKVY